MKYTIPSVSRIIAFAKYLVALSESLGFPKDEKSPSLEKQKERLTRWKRLHILYLINDLLHHTKYHIQSKSVFSTLSENLWTYMIDLFRIASADDSTGSSLHNKNIQDLVTIWAEKGYYDDRSIQKLRDTIVKPVIVESSDTDGSLKIPNGTIGATLSEQNIEAQYFMPVTHGDSATPYYDLPAGNMMPHIVSNLIKPINPQSVKPLHFTRGAATEDLVIAMKYFMKDISMNVGSGEQVNNCVDINDLGQPTFRDESTGDLIGADGYYGWSRAFCEKMRLRQNASGRYTKVSGNIRDAEQSWNPRKRPRYNRSESNTSSNRSRSRSTASHLSPPRRRTPSRQGTRQRPYSRGRSPIGHNSTAGLRSTTRSNSYSPPPPPHPPNVNRQTPIPVETQHSKGFHLPRSDTLPQTLHQSYPFGPGGMPIPPPPPPNFQGIWPPPPPPPPAQLSQNFIPPGSSYPAFQNFAPPHPSGAPISGHFPFVHDYLGHPQVSASSNSRVPQEPSAANHQNDRYS